MVNKQEDETIKIRKRNALYAKRRKEWAAEVRAEKWRVLTEGRARNFFAILIIITFFFGRSNWISIEIGIFFIASFIIRIMDDSKKKG